MMLRILICCTAVVLGSSLNVAAAPACDDEGCQTAAKVKPLDIMQFMREQAASTRKAAPRPAKARPIAHSQQRPPRRAIAARPKPAELPIEASTSFASQPKPAGSTPTVQVVDSDELNAIDRAGTAAPAETVGAPMAPEHNVQLVDAEEFNDLDRQAGDRPTPSAEIAAIANAQAGGGKSSTSWLQWIWSAVGSTFTALAAAVHQLVGL
jgi:hypothetical protein